MTLPQPAGWEATARTREVCGLRTALASQLSVNVPRVTQQSQGHREAGTALWAE